MKTITACFPLVCMLLYTLLAVFLITRFRSLLTALPGTALLMAGGWGVYLIAPYILTGLIWGIRFGTVIVVMLFVFRVIPRPRHDTAIRTAG